MNDTFLLRRIKYTPCFVKIYCDIPIKFLQEIYFNSIVCLPKAIFNKKKFRKYEIIDDYIKIDMSEWISFLNELMKVYEGKSIGKITDTIIKKLDYFSIYVDKCFKKKNIKSNELKKLFELMAEADSFAIFNMFLPIDKYNDELKNKNIASSIEDIMICSFEPHRIQLRKNKLELAIKYAKNIINDKDYSEYFDKYVFYEEFEKWIFDVEKYTNREYIERELKRTTKKYTIEEFEKELKQIQINREMCLQRAFDFVEQIDEDEIEKYSFLSIIVSEEERRHMIECKLLLLIGLTFKNIDIDIGRSSINELLYALYEEINYV